MDTHEQQPPCAADALFGIRRISVKGRDIGITGLCEAIGDVRAHRLTGEEEIKEALLEFVSRHNYIPPELRPEYAEALLLEYRNDECRTAGVRGS